MEVTVEPIGDAPAFAERWADLAGRAVNATAFQSPAWMSFWLERARGRAALHALVAEDALLGVVGVRREGRLKGSVARLAETGDEAFDAVYVEHNDLLLTEGAPPDARRRAVAAMIDGLGATSIVLRNVPPPLRQAALSAARDAGWAFRVVMEQPTYEADLRAPAAFSRNTRQQVARTRRLYEEKGPLVLDIATAPAARAEAFGTLLRLHEGVWRARGQEGAFAPEVRAFHEALIARDDPLTEILTLRAGGEPIGVLYCLRHGITAYQYQSGFAGEADNRLKPGLLTHAMAMDHYREAGLSAYDMMAGKARYKASLGAPAKRLSVIELAKPGLRQKLRGVARGFRR